MGSYHRRGSYTKHIHRMEFENSVLGSAVVISERDAYTTTVFSEGLVVEVVDEVTGEVGEAEDVDEDVEVVVVDDEEVVVEVVGAGFCVM